MAKWILALLVSTLQIGFAEDGVKIEYKPLSIGALQEFGMLKSGRFGTAPTTFKNEWTDHMGAFLTQEVKASERLTFRIGLGGIFEFQKPEKINPNWGGTQYRNFFVGPTTADLNYSIPLSSSNFSIGLGMFPFKYNPDAANLGEYLFRSGPYPGYIWSGGYSYLGDNQAYLQGMKSHYAMGSFSADILLLTETTFPPLYDLSLAALVKYKIADGLLTLTGGVNFKRLVSIHPSRTSVQSPENAYFTNSNGTWTGNLEYYRQHASFYQTRADSIAAQADRLNSKNTAGDSALATAKLSEIPALKAQQAKWKANTDSVKWWTVDTANHGPKPSLNYYTQAGIITVASAALDFKKLFSSEYFGPNDMRLYAELALLGIKDYPIFYEKKSERMPLMIGFNFPGFKVFDLISLQAEIYKSAWLNSYAQSVVNNHAVPEIPLGSDGINSAAEYKDITQKDDIYWSLLIRKQLVAGLMLSGQVARDHIRTVSEATWAGPGTDPNEMLYSNKNWYWMLQFSFGI